MVAKIQVFLIKKIQYIPWNIRNNSVFNEHRAVRKVCKDAREEILIPYSKSCH